MRLLHHSGKRVLRLTEFSGDEIPHPYAILSHTWRLDGDEVTFKDILEGTAESKAGYDKIRFCEEQAAYDDLQYFWVDTCCIDKSSSSELLEAINSMFQWYHNAAKCYVYLWDVSSHVLDTHDEFNPLHCESAFRASRWFTRGWTLQELLAPRSVEFFSREGNRIGDKKSLERQIHEITGIAVTALRGAPLSQFGVDERLSWVESRQTTRKEDKAYSLLGIFDVYMPLLYGEGRDKAFKRLRREIDNNSVEMTVLPSPQVSTALTSERRSYAFYNLEAISENPSVKSYWNYLTLTALTQYEKVYNMAKDPHTGLVHYEAFAQQFPHEPPSKSLVETIWKRIDHTMKALLPRNLTLALIYMLHVETHSNMRPEDIGYVRRAMLACYGNWVECSCQCGRQWSFANGKQGLWRVVQDVSGKDRDGKRMCCKVTRRQDCNLAMRWLYKHGTEWMNKNRIRWLGDPQYMEFLTR